MIGEILIDATANPFNPGVAVIAFHLSGRLILRRGRDYETALLEKDWPYGHSVRDMSSPT
jgi:hypothetical protein